MMSFFYCFSDIIIKLYVLTLLKFIILRENRTVVTASYFLLTISANNQLKQIESLVSTYISVGMGYV